MPTYEYKCNACGKEFEVFRSITDESLPTCPGCGSKDVVRLISATSFILKGSGWYMTDYGNKHSSSSDNKPPKKDSGGVGSSDKSDNSAKTKEN